MIIVACLMASHADRERFVDQNVLNALLPGRADYVVLVNGGTHDFDIQHNTRVVTVKQRWGDNFPKQRNAYLQTVDQIATQVGTDVLICSFDDDEVYSSDLWDNMRSVGQWALEEDKNQLAIQSQSVVLNKKGEEIKRHIDDYWKALIFLWEPGMYYFSTGPDRVTPSTDSFVHELLYIPSGTRHAQLTNPEWYYSHIKTIGEVYFRSTRNAWAGGGGPNLGESNPLWRPFQNLVRSVAPQVQTSMDWENYLKVGHIHDVVKNAILANRFLGTPHDSRTNLWGCWPDGTSEWREMALTYFVMLHPEELDPKIIESDRGKLDWETEIRQVHGE